MPTPPISSPLRIHPTNPRYFTDNTGRAIYLTGSHTWANLQDIGLIGQPSFPFDQYLDFMTSHGHNFMRLWMFEQPQNACWTASPLLFTPLPWACTGPGQAIDGQPKFNLDVWNEDYFRRLRARTIAAGQRGIYVAIMLFQGWSLHKTTADFGDPWPFHPFNAANNVNGVDVPYPRMDDDVNPCLHSLANPAALARQEAYVRKVIDTVNDLDNVLYEIINEGGATAWQYHMVDLIHAYERHKLKQHPVGMTHRIFPHQNNSALFASNADWVSPANEPRHLNNPAAVPLEDYQNDPPVADGRKIILSDTDHLWGHGGNYRWAWKSFLRGHHPIFMDPWWPLYVNADPKISPWVFIGGICTDRPDYPDWNPLRRAMGDTLRFANRMNLAAMLPHPELVSTRYCLADPGREYLIYLPEGGPATLNLRHARTPLTAEWFIPQINRTFPLDTLLAPGDYTVVHAPYSGDAVLYLKSQGQ